METTQISRLELLDAVTKALVDPVFVLDYDGRYLDALGGSERGAYDSIAYVVGKTLHDIMPKEMADKFLVDVRKVIDSRQPLVYEYTLAAEDLEGNVNDGPQGRQWFQGRIAPIITDSEGVPSCVAWVVINITRRRELEAELERLATTDELTGLLNRRALIDHLDTVMKEATAMGAQPPVAMALLDLDCFKNVNDRFGHTVGDAVLQHVCRILQKCAGGSETLGRFGGEEFAVVFAARSQEEANSWLRDALRALDETPYTIGQDVIPMGFSAGVVVAGLEDRNPGDLIHRADHWLYEAKNAGRHCIAFPGWIERRQR